jgi:hypothetical protein
MPTLGCQPGVFPGFSFSLAPFLDVRRERRKWNRNFVILIFQRGHKSRRKRRKDLFPFSSPSLKK